MNWLSLLIILQVYYYLKFPDYICYLFQKVLIHKLNYNYILWLNLVIYILITCWKVNNGNIYLENT
jgi:mannosyltransferase OCH1-like enzyme